MISATELTSQVDANQRFNRAMTNIYVKLYHKILTFYDVFCRANLYEYDLADCTPDQGSLSSPFKRLFKADDDDNNNNNKINQVKRFCSRFFTMPLNLIRQIKTTSGFKDTLKRIDFSILLARFVLFYYIVVNVSFSVSIYYQYIYDYYNYHRRRLMEAELSQNLPVMRKYRDSNVTIEKIDRKLMSVREDLKCFGSPLMDAPYLAETTYLLMMVLAFLSYFGPLVYFRYNGPFDFYFVRMFMNWPREQNKCELMLREQLAHYLVSSQNFTQISLDQWRINNRGLNYTTSNQFARRRSNLLDLYCHPSNSIRNNQQSHELGAEKTILTNYKRQHNYIWQHQWSEKKLNEFYVSSYLQPLNRSNSAWIIQVAKCVSFMTVGIPLSTFTWNIFLFSTLPYFSGFEYQSSLMDVWAFIELASLNIILTLGGVFYIHLAIVNCVEQVHIAGQLKGLIKRFIDVNMRLFHEHVDRDSNVAAPTTADHDERNDTNFNNNALADYGDTCSSDDDDDDYNYDWQDATDHLMEYFEDDYCNLENRYCEMIVGHSRIDLPRLISDNSTTGDQQESSQTMGNFKPLVDTRKKEPTGAQIFLRKHQEQMNIDLLYIIIHYKIFIAQLRPTKKSIGFVTLCSVGLMTIFPILARLHLPYISNQAAKVLSIIVCLLMAFLADFSLIPVCWMNSRCLSLYNSLSRLMAHLVELSNHPETGQLFDRHTIWLLRKELNHPERIASQFATSSMGMSFTYSRMLRIHFWIGLVVISLYIELRSTSGDIYLGDFLSDPLGIERNLPRV